MCISKSNHRVSTSRDHRCLHKHLLIVQHLGLYGMLATACPQRSATAVFPISVLTIYAALKIHPCTIAAGKL